MNLPDMIADIQHAIEEDEARGYNTKLLSKALKHYKKAYDYCAQCHLGIKYVRKTANQVDKGNYYVSKYQNQHKYSSNQRP